MIDPARLGATLRQRRRKLGWSLRRAADEIGVSFNTVARVEQGHLPELENYRKLTAWLGIGDTGATAEMTDTLEMITSHLQRDPALTEEAAHRITRVMRELYEALAKPTPTSAVHLRTASTFRPEAARLLGELLSDMRERLESEGAAS